MSSRLPKQLTVWDEVYFAAAETVNKRDLSPGDKDILVSIVSAGARCAGAFYAQLGDLFRRFGDVAFERALPFVEVFAMAMVSRWVRYVCDQSPEFDRPTMWARLARDVLNLFGTFSEERYEEARLMDVQFNAARDARLKGEPGTGWESAELDMIMWLATRALGARPPGKLTSSAVPAKGSYALHKFTGIEPFTDDIEVSSRAHDTLLACEADIYASFEALQRDRRSFRSKVASSVSRLGGLFRKTH